MKSLLQACRVLFQVPFTSTCSLTLFSASCRPPWPQSHRSWHPALHGRAKCAFCGSFNLASLPAPLTLLQRLLLAASYSTCVT